MGLDKKYDYQKSEAAMAAAWEQGGIYRFDPDSDREVYAIDTPPPTVSGQLHMGHVYSYTHADIVARFQRMAGKEVFYPMGFDDNGLPTELLVEKTLGQRAEEMGADEFRARCLAAGGAAAEEYRSLWRALGLSVDWRQTYRTIGDEARRIAQWSFIDLHRKGRVYRREAPVIWCPQCRTAIAQAELEERERESVFCELAFGEGLRVATTRPELLPACAAVFVHPADARYAGLAGREVAVPLQDRAVPVIADEGADPEIGTGAVMCCTFGDAADVDWWRRHDLPLRAAIGRDGRMVAGECAGLGVAQARERVVADLADRGLLLGRRPTRQVVRVHERCGEPVEYVLAPQWFVKMLDCKDQLRAAGAAIAWHPPHMETKYQQWLEQLGWDWCISRQRPFGVPFPAWHCADCGAVQVAAEGELPVDPRGERRPCDCGGQLRGDGDVMDTWATSSLTPQLAGMGGQVMAVRPLAHEIIRTWAFYSVVKAHYHWGRPPWRALMVSGWGLAPKGQGKISKSRGGGALKPERALQRYPADALRYWAASTALGKDAYISEDKMRAGVKLVNKLWNAARFAERFIAGYRPPAAPPPLSPADAWILDRLQRLVESATRRIEAFDYAAAKSEIEVFFWRDLVDDYFEMAKKRLYAGTGAGARYALYWSLLDLVKMLAPFMPYITEAIHAALFAEPGASVHRADWPRARPALLDAAAAATGERLRAVARAVRRYKSDAGLPLGTELALLEIAGGAGCEGAGDDLASITRARKVTWVAAPGPRTEKVAGECGLQLGIIRAIG